MEAKKHPPKMVFFGTPHFATAVLAELWEAGLPPTLIVTAPDRPRGRGLELSSPEARVWAEEHGIDVLQPEKLDADFVAEMENSEWDLFVVASYGKILPKALLDVPVHGTLNVHPSLLPRWRGASPIQSAILEDEGSGVTVMLLNEKMDEGPVVAQASVDVEKWPPKGSLLSELLASEGGKLLAEVIPLWLSGNIEPEEQDHAKATYSKKVLKEDGFIDVAGDPEKNYRKFQAYDVWPGTYFFTKKKVGKVRIKITDAALEKGTFVIKKVIPEGKSEMSYRDFLRGNH